MKPIKYEQHPISPERKAELIAAGFKIVDARFAPLGDIVATGADAPQPMPAPTARRGRPKKGAE